MKFSVLMSVYRNDKPEDFRTAVESVTIRQTLQPDEVVLVVDGPVPERLQSTIKELEREIPSIKPIWLEKNGGLGSALRIGMEYASNKIVARMDADDISEPDRFAKQIEFLEKNKGISIVGGQIDEFIGEISNIVGNRKVPSEHKNIYKMLKSRCPFNHVTVTFRRSDVLSVGNYIDWHFNEDYYLWIRMALAGLKFANLDEVLVNVRVGNEMYIRRGGWKYFKSEEGLQRYMLQRGLISLPRYLFNTTGRFVIQVAVPNSFRSWIYQTFFRK